MRLNPTRVARETASHARARDRAVARDHRRALTLTIHARGVDGAQGRRRTDEKGPRRTGEKDGFVFVEDGERWWRRDARDADVGCAGRADARAEVAEGVRGGWGDAG